MAKFLKSANVPRIVLVGSLALNVLLVGAIIGSFASGGSGGQRGFDLQVGPLGQALPPEDRAAIGRELRENLRNKDIGGRDRGAAAQAVIAMLEAEVFDVEAFGATIRSQQTRQDQVRESALDAFVSHISKMSVDERRVMAATLKEQRARPNRDRP